MTPQETRQAGAEIEVTEEMIEAGVDALYGELNGWHEATRRERHCALAAALLAMLDTAHKSSGRRLTFFVECQSLPSK